jgi:hypothetical protein
MKMFWSQLPSGDWVLFNKPTGIPRTPIARVTVKRGKGYATKAGRLINWDTPTSVAKAKKIAEAFA